MTVAIAAGIVLLVVAWIVSGTLSRSSVVTEFGAPASGVATAGANQLDNLPETKVTATESRPPDAVVVTLLTLAVLVLLAGAFYPRISKISLGPVGDIEMKYYTEAAKAIDRRVHEQVPEQKPSTAEIAAAVAIAAHRAALEGGVSARLPARARIAATNWDELADEALKEVRNPITGN